MVERQGGGDASGVDSLHDRALGAVTGLRVGEVLGAETEGLPRVAAATALQAAFPDFGVTTPGFVAVTEACGVEEPSDAGRQRPLAVVAVPALPAWVALSVATALEVRADPIEDLVKAVGERLALEDRDRLTFAAAAAVAAAVSAALDRTPWLQCLSLAISAADLAESSAGVYRAGASVGARLAWAHALATRAEEPAAVVELLVGASEIPQEAVPAAFAMVGVQAASGAAQPMATLQSAAALGGRAGLVVPVAGTVAGALAGVSAFPAHVRDDTDLTPVLARRGDG